MSFHDHEKGGYNGPAKQSQPEKKPNTANLKKGQEIFTVVGLTLSRYRYFTPYPSAKFVGHLIIDEKNLPVKIHDDSLKVYIEQPYAFDIDLARLHLVKQLEEKAKILREHLPKHLREQK